MNEQQRLYYDQAKSDFEIFEFREGKPACHQLHYLQMCTEKLGKAYFGRGLLATRSHAGFVSFLKSLSTRRNVWEALGFERREDLEKYVRSNQSLAPDLERLAPTLAGDGPTPEYPWPPPPNQAVHGPLSFDFPVWNKLRNSGRGRHFQRFVKRLLTIFPEWF